MPLSTKLAKFAVRIAALFLLMPIGGNDAQAQQPAVSYYYFYGFIGPVAGATVYPTPALACTEGFSQLFSPVAFKGVYTGGNSCDVVCIGNFTTQCGQLSVGRALIGDVVCPLGQEGFILPNGGASCSSAVVAQRKNLDKSCPSCRNPINPGTGNKTQRAIDYRGAGQFPLSMERVYNSLSPGRIGYWTGSYMQFLTYKGATPWVSQNASVQRQSGNSYLFANPPTPSSPWVSERDVKDALITYFNSGNSTAIAGWTYRSQRTEEVDLFDSGGALLQTTNRQGLVQRLGYSDGLGGMYYGSTSPTFATIHPETYVPATCLPPSGFVHQLDAAGQPVIPPSPPNLLCVEDAFGRQINFQRDVLGRIVRFSDPAGNIFAYEYSGTNGAIGANNVTKIIYPDGKSVIYHYNESAHTSGANLPNALTGITDENGVRFATYKYNAAGLAISSEHAGGVEKSNVSYAVPAPGQTTIAEVLGDPANPLTNSRVYAFALSNGVVKNTSVVDPATGQPTPCIDCGGSGATTFDTNGNVSSRTDWNGNKTCFGYDLARNLETRRIEGLASGANCAALLTGTPSLTAPARMVSTVWHPEWRLPVQIAEPLRITTMSYGAAADPNPGNRGSMLSRSVQATTDATGALGLAAQPAGTARVWTNTYNANGSVLTMDGPRTDAADTTTYTYYPNNDADIGKRGNVATVTNAAGHVTQITAYNAHGQPLTIIDPNGLTTQLTYDVRQRLTARNVGGETTTYEYDGVGQLTKVTLPDQSFVTYTYDAAHRLTAMADNLGNRIAYTLDLMGNRTQEEVFDPANQLAQKRSRVYNAINRLTQEIGATNQTTQYEYDNQGNLTKVTDPLNRITTNSYDALNRLAAMTQPQITLPGGGTVNPVVAYGYDGLDQLVQVTDPRSLVTRYTYDGLGNMSAQQSPDTGSTTATFDAAGNVLTRTDSAGRTSTYTYDALNRVITASHAQSGQPTVSYTYTYDQGTAGNFGKGRLTQIAEASGNINYTYDVHGRVTSETRGITGNTATTAYTYDAAGRLNRITYPSGRIVDYSFDALGRIAGVTTRQDANAAPQTVVSNVSYHPFRSDAGGVTGFTLGNGRVHTRSVDLDGRIASYTQAGQNIAIAYDNASNITGIGPNTYGYDALNRLTSAVTNNAGAATHGYAYDATGNRLQTTGANPATLTVDSQSNRLATLQTPAGTRTMQYDLAGAIINDGNAQFGYDARNRMVSSTVGGNTTQYEINALGERVRKTNGAGLNTAGSIFHYDRQGKLIAETNAQGQVVREILYLLDLPVGVFQ